VYRFLIDGARLAARSAATPAYFGMRWIGDWDRRTTDWLVPAWSDVLLQLKVAADEVFFASELRVGMNIGAFLDGQRVRHACARMSDSDRSAGGRIRDVPSATPANAGYRLQPGARPLRGQ